MRDEQHEVAGILLAATERFGFVLAGGYAIALHGVGRRPSEDVDIFTNVADPADFTAAVDLAAVALQASGWQTEVTRRGDTFARVLASRGDSRVDVDMGVDYRERPPARMEIGPVLSFRDAAGSKMAALYGRGEVRDYLDVYEVLHSGRVSRSQLLAWGDTREAQPMDRGLLVHRLKAVTRIAALEFAAYSVDDEYAERVRNALDGWGQTIASEIVRSQTGASFGTTASAEQRRPDGPKVEQ